MRNKFHNGILDTNESLTDYFGKFSKIPKHFTFVGGQRRLVLILADICRKIQEPKASSSVALNQG